MPSASFTVDSVIANKRFTADAVIIGNRLRHDRTLDHNGTQDTTTVVLSSAIGPYPTGTTVQVVLVDFAARLLALESANHVFDDFTVDAFILPHFWINAVVKRTVSGSFTADAVITLVGPHSFTVDAAIFRVSSATTFTINAFIV